MRKSLVAANWKMNKTTSEATAAATAVVAGGPFEGVDVVICPPATSIAYVAAAVAGSGIGVGAQNVHWESDGAFTGELSTGMILDAGCRYSIVGHSERRSLFGETDLDVQRKSRALLDAGLVPIVCVGETLEQREAGSTESILATQLAASLDGLGGALPTIVLAYEPVWAIGTGLTATPEQAQEAHRFLRDRLADLGGEAAAAATRILYGGSVKPANAAELFGQPDVDGGLIGGASLDPASFLAIVAAG